jgi:Immunoglobulin-like domain of bacterial spore germination
MPDPNVPDDELMQLARAYMARLTSQPPPRNLAEDAVKAALSRRRRFSLAGLLGGSAVIIVGAAAAVVALAFHNGPVAGIPAGTAPAASTASPATTPANTSTPATTPIPAANVCQANLHPATSAQVIVSQPAAYAQVTSPLTVSGTINAFEATFQIAIKEASGRNLTTQTGHSQQGQTLSAFSADVSFKVNAQTSACLWVFQLSARDGTPQTIQQVPITLMP